MVDILNEIFNIVQTEIPTSFNEFVIDKTNLKQIFKNVKHCILSSKNYNKMKENWYKKYKAKIYGNCCLYPIIFIYILNVCGIYSNIKQPKEYIL